MIVQFSGADDSSQTASVIPQLLPNADPVTNALIIGALGWFLLTQLKHKAKQKRVSRLRSKAKSLQSRLRSAEARVTKRGSKRMF